MSDDEEELTLYIEFNGLLHEDILSDPKVTFKVIGYDKDNPIIQIGDEIYEGEYEDTFGTMVIFEEDTNPTVQSDEVFGKQVPKRVQYLTKTNKLIRMNRIFLNEKNSSATSPGNEETDTNLSKTYEEALNKLDECCLKIHSNKQE